MRMWMVMRMRMTFVMMMVISFFVVSMFPDVGIGLLVFSLIGLFVSACGYSPSKRIVYSTMNKSESVFIKEEYARRQKEKMKKKKREKKS